MDDRKKAGGKPKPGGHKWLCWGCNKLHPQHHSSCHWCHKEDKPDKKLQPDKKPGQHKGNDKLPNAGDGHTAASLAPPPGHADGAPIPSDDDQDMSLEAAMSFLQLVGDSHPAHLDALVSKARLVVERNKPKPPVDVVAAAPKYSSGQLMGAEARVKNATAKLETLQKDALAAQEALEEANSAVCAGEKSLEEAKQKVVEIKTSLAHENETFTPQTALECLQRLEHIYSQVAVGAATPGQLELAFAQAKTATGVNTVGAPDATQTQPQVYNIAEDQPWAGLDNHGDLNDGDHSSMSVERPSWVSVVNGKSRARSMSPSHGRASRSRTGPYTGDLLAKHASGSSMSNRDRSRTPLPGATAGSPQCS